MRKKPDLPIYQTRPTKPIYHIPRKCRVLEKCGLLIKEVVEKTRKKSEI